MSLTKNMFQHVQGFRDKEVFVLLLKPLPFSYFYPNLIKKVIFSSFL